MTAIYHSNVRGDVLALLPPRQFGRVLEVGGGDFPTLLQIAGSPDVEDWGVDVRDTTARLSHFVKGSITDDEVAVQLPDGWFDLILANDVIEHVADTDKFLATLYRKLQPGGILALSVPNARQMRLAFSLLFRGRFPRTDAGLFDRTHLRWFCRRDVEELAGNAGFKQLLHRLRGRLVPRFATQMRTAELLALHNIFLFTK